MFWKNKVVFLTGASSGIGEALAIEISKRGALVVGLLARRAEMLREISNKIEQSGGAARTFSVDVSDAEAIAKAAHSLRNEFGKIDVLIANAGISGGNFEAKNLEAEAVSKVINTNLIGAVNSVAAVLPQMLERKSGQLVAISSLAGFRGLPKSAAYSASKAGMTAFFESIRLDVQNQGVAVTIVQPGFIKTPLTSGREAKMPVLMELDDAVPLFLTAIEKRKKFAAFPWQLATVVRVARFFPAALYDKIADRARFRE
ncbi:MAG: SDR family NAD(P)-dependent oxidoreductase [Acidobacteria bacterium]|nr:SDR family NAD(P)-dependent oxidoreductase [Acidobacteriota bacterium]